MYTSADPPNMTVENGFIRVYNSGAFIAYFAIAYDLNGQHVIKISPTLPVLTSATLYIPDGATNVEFEAYIAVYIQAWRSIYRTKFDNIPQKCYKLTGITWYANCTEVPCNNIDAEIPPISGMHPELGVQTQPYPPMPPMPPVHPINPCCCHCEPCCCKHDIHPPKPPTPPTPPKPPCKKHDCKCRCRNRR
ncbi:MAG: hypothetical protein RR838_03475 [Clostridium sp.]